MGRSSPESRKEAFNSAYESGWLNTSISFCLTWPPVSKAAAKEGVEHGQATREAKRDLQQDQPSPAASNLQSLPLEQDLPHASAEGRRGDAPRPALQGPVHGCGCHSAGERASQLARYGTRRILTLCTSFLPLLSRYLAPLILINHRNNRGDNRDSNLQSNMN